MKVGVVFVLALVAASAGAEVQHGEQGIGRLESDGTYRLSGDEVPIYYVVESFLLDAAGFYALNDAAAYQAFCEKFGIESGWPAASSRGALIDEVLEV
jgi:hypothetical protein